MYILLRLSYNNINLFEGDATMTQEKWNEQTLRQIIADTQDTLTNYASGFHLLFGTQRSPKVTPDMLKLTLNGLKFELLPTAPYASYIEKTDVSMLREGIQEALDKFKPLYNIDRIDIGTATYSDRFVRFSTLTFTYLVSNKEKSSQILANLREAVNLGLAEGLPGTQTALLLSSDFPLKWYKYKRSIFRVIDIDLYKQSNVVKLENKEGKVYYANIRYLYSMLAEGKRV